MPTYTSRGIFSFPLFTVGEELQHMAVSLLKVKDRIMAVRWWNNERWRVFWYLKADIRNGRKPYTVTKQNEVNIVWCWKDFNKSVSGKKSWKGWKNTSSNSEKSVVGMKEDWSNGGRTKWILHGKERAKVHHREIKECAQKKCSRGRM